MVPREELWNESDRSQEPVPSRLGRLLIVDDEPAVRLLTERALRRAGHEVQTAAHGDDALRIIKQRAAEIELLIADQSMPGISGRDLVKRVKRDYPQIAVIMSSGHVIDEAALAVAPDGILAKPYRMAELMVLVEQVLAARDSTADHRS